MSGASSSIFVLMPVVRYRLPQSIMVRVLILVSMYSAMSGVKAGCRMSRISVSRALVSAVVMGRSSRMRHSMARLRTLCWCVFIGFVSSVPLPPALGVSSQDFPR